MAPMRRSEASQMKARPHPCPLPRGEGESPTAGRHCEGVQFVGRWRTFPPLLGLRTKSRRKPPLAWAGVRAVVTCLASRAIMVFCACAMLMLSVACHSNKQTPGQRAQAARALFEQTTKSYHIPSAEAKGDEKLKLQEQAVAGYR